MHSELADSNATMATPVPVVKSTAVLKKTCRPNLNWNQEMILALVKQVQASGAHLTKRGTPASSKAWKEVNVNLYKERCMIPYQSTFNEDGSRKLRDKFDATVSSTVTALLCDLEPQSRVWTRVKYPREESNLLRYTAIEFSNI